ncbi:hypothetical protein AVEN_58557-1 [Araneus ventricosus]|uniref:Reverse transcriptase/retrotransposon-derived protein RNase H-like domain-containing protein n=1 Tax=Araneus ventricosus TaxID=182803 RepID=A0A4Y2BSE6_ARAVE|nr:hypothetical protein AVEN_58557-1 [Araneus ventricosus]
MCETLCLFFKLKGIFVSSAADSCRPNSQLFITDLVTRHKFLVDSGAAVCCYPKKLTNFSVKQDLELYAVNGSRISTYGTIKLELDFGLRRSFIWSFLVADVSDPIIGADFLERFELLIDIRNRRLLDGRTSLFVKGMLKRTKSLDTAKEQACLHSLVKNKVTKENNPIAWTEDTRSAFESCKRLIANAIALSFPAADARLSLMTDASDFAVGAVLQQHIESKVEPLDFFSRKLTATEKKYSTFDRELLSIYLSVKHFRYMLEGREVIYTDHKPLQGSYTFP